MAASHQPPPVLSVKKTAAPPDGLADLQVWSVPSVNRQILICHAPGADGTDPTQLVCVAVRTNSNFLKGMPVRARRVTATRFLLEGPCPRWRGRW